MAGFGEAFAQAFGEALAAGLAAAFYIVLLLMVSFLTSAVLLFFAGLRTRPRTTLLAYAFAFLGFIIGSAIDQELILFLGFIVGAAIGWKWFEDSVPALLRSSRYAWFVKILGGAGILVGLGITGDFMAKFGPYIGDAALQNPASAIALFGILLSPSFIGAYILAGDRIRAWWKNR